MRKCRVREGGPADGQGGGGHSAHGLINHQGRGGGGPGAGAGGGEAGSGLLSSPPALLTVATHPRHSPKDPAPPAPHLVPFNYSQD